MARPRRRHDTRRAGARRALSVRRAVALGIVQGAAELAPVSSSAHVALLSRGLDVPRRRSVEVALHGGTALALPWAVRDVTARVPRGLRGAVFLAATLTPPVVVGALAADAIERRAAGRWPIPAGLLGGAIALAWADQPHGGSAPAPARDPRDATAADGLALGLAQAVALFPGVSRRGATLAAARARGFDRDGAGDLSWAAGVPVLAAAATHGVVVGARRGDLRRDLPALAVGAAAAGLTLAALAPARGTIERTPYAAWAAWRAVIAAAAAARPG